MTGVLPQKIFSNPLGAVAGLITAVTDVVLTASRDTGLLRSAAIFIILSQGLLSIVAAVSGMMLHADGAWFVYALGVGEPWDLKWHLLATRATTYALSVWPTQVISGGLDLGLLQIAVLNGLAFYGLQVVQLAIAAMLVWRRAPALLFFPIASHVLGTGLGFGFPSEILFGPGFLWIGLFLLELRKPPLVLFLLCFLGLVFSHELLFPTAVVMAFAAWRKLSATPEGHAAARAWLVALACVAILAGMLIVRSQGGGAGGDPMMIYVFDPRRVLDNPTLWLMTLLALVTGLAAAFGAGRKGPVWLIAVAMVGLALPFLLQPWLNFADGRYPARTIVAISALGLSLLYVVIQHRRPAGWPPTIGETTIAPASRLILVGLLMVQFAASAVFVMEWRLARGGFDRVMSASPATSKIRFTPTEQALGMMTPGEARANRRLEISWSHAFRSVVLGDGTPRVVIYDPAWTNYVCGEVAQGLDKAGVVPLSTRVAIRDFQCAQPAPPVAEGGLGRRLLDRLRKWVTI